MVSDSLWREAFNGSVLILLLVFDESSPFCVSVLVLIFILFPVLPFLCFKH